MCDESFNKKCKTQTCHLLAWARLHTNIYGHLFLAKLYTAMNHFQQQTDLQASRERNGRFEQGTGIMWIIFASLHFLVSIRVRFYSLFVFWLFLLRENCSRVSKSLLFLVITALGIQLQGSTDYNWDVFSMIFMANSWLSWGFIPSSVRAMLPIPRPFPCILWNSGVLVTTLCSSNPVTSSLSETWCISIRTMYEKAPRTPPNRQPTTGTQDQLFASLRKINEPL